MSDPAHVMVVEDEREIRELMALHLLRQGFQVKECQDTKEAHSEISKNKFQLIVLDWMLPGQSGLEFLRDLKTAKYDSKVLMVTARAEADDIVHGLEKGADDYLTKPFDPNIFMARVKALLRRKVQDEKPKTDTFEVEGLEINQSTYEVKVNGEPLHLTPSEFKLLVNMVENRGRVLTRDQLIEKIQGEGVNVIGRTIDTHVFGLRKKLGTWGDNIETIRGIGYRVKIDFN
ncbi:MAG: response regulator transcription factor [Bdellovibrionota bacterium]